MPVEVCKQCGEMMTEQPAAHGTADLRGSARQSARFDEQWFVCRNGHRRGYISGHSRPPGAMRVMSQTDIICIRT